MKTNIVFFDAKCPLCRSCIRLLIKLDANQKLAFAPLSGQTARLCFKEKYPVIRKENTLIFFMRHRPLKKRASALIWILWTLGGCYRLGLLLLPLTPIFNICYRALALLRYYMPLGRRTSFSDKEKQRLLS